MDDISPLKRASMCARGTDTLQTPPIRSTHTRLSGHRLTVARLGTMGMAVITLPQRRVEETQT